MREQPHLYRWPDGSYRSQHPTDPQRWYLDAQEDQAALGYGSPQRLADARQAAGLAPRRQPREPDNPFWQMIQLLMRETM